MHIVSKSLHRPCRTGCCTRRTSYTGTPSTSSSDQRPRTWRDSCPPETHSTELLPLTSTSPSSVRNCQLPATSPLLPSLRFIPLLSSPPVPSFSLPSGQWYESLSTCTPLPPCHTMTPLRLSVAPLPPWPMYLTRPDDDADVPSPPLPMTSSFPTARMMKMKKAEAEEMASTVQEWADTS